jgi:hypothetical protein
MADILKFRRKPEPIRLRCTGCGATTEAPCGCGVRFRILRPGEAAKRAIKKDPRMSDRAIAKNIGVTSNTVRRARKTTAPFGAVNKNERRVGQDGKARRMPTPQPQKKNRWHSCKTNPIPLPTSVAEVRINHAMGLIIPLLYNEMVILFHRFRTSTDNKEMQTWRKLVKAFKVSSSNAE